MLAATTTVRLNHGFPIPPRESLPTLPRRLTLDRCPPSYAGVSDIYYVGKPQCPTPPPSTFANTTACPVVTPNPAPATSSFRVAVITDNHITDDCYPWCVSPRPPGLTLNRSRF